MGRRGQRRRYHLGHTGAPKIGEALLQLLALLDLAIAKAYTENVFTDDINPPPTNSKRS
jgi:hypothetical protein